jgi:hypothetical protein
MNRLVVIDIDLPQLENNRFFEAEAAGKVSHTILPWCYFAAEAKKQGIEMVTGDVYLAMTDRPKNALLISHMITPRTHALIAAGAKPFALFSQESPLIAFRFFFDLSRHSALYPHVFVPRGFKNKVAVSSQFHDLYFPEPYTVGATIPGDWRLRKHLTMISGNKRSPFTLKRFIGGVLSGKFYREFYKERLAAIEYFAGKEFDLYGIGWQKPFLGETPEMRRAITTCYRGPVDDKLATLKQYRFTFTMENTSAPGYVTEKIFDAIFAGSIPLYLGAPDITDYVPADCFIDLRKYRDFKELDAYLKNLTDTDFARFHAAMQRFAGSAEYAPFSQEFFANEMINLIKKAN